MFVDLIATFDEMKFGVFDKAEEDLDEDQFLAFGQELLEVR